MRARGAAVLAVSLLVTGCVGGGGPEGEFDDGSATLTVTYRPGPAADPVSVDVTVQGTDCYVDVAGTHFGADVDPAARAEHLTTVAEDVSAPLGFYAGDVSGLAGPEAVLSVVLPAGGVFISREPLTFTDGRFEVTDVAGTVGDSARTGTASIDAEASVTGEFVCGSTETFGS